MIKVDKDKKLTPEQEERAKNSLAFMQKLKEEGKLLEHFHAAEGAAEKADPDWDALLK